MHSNRPAAFSTLVLLPILIMALNRMPGGGPSCGAGEGALFVDVTPDGYQIAVGDEKVATIPCVGECAFEHHDPRRLEDLLARMGRGCPVGDAIAIRADEGASAELVAATVAAARAPQRGGAPIFQSVQLTTRAP